MMLLPAHSDPPMHLHYASGFFVLERSYMWLRDGRFFLVTLVQIIYLTDANIILRIEIE